MFEQDLTNDSLGLVLLCLRKDDRRRWTYVWREYVCACQRSDNMLFPFFFHSDRKLLIISTLCVQWRYPLFQASPLPCDPSHGMLCWQRHLLGLTTPENNFPFTKINALLPKTKTIVYMCKVGRSIATQKWSGLADIQTWVLAHFKRSGNWRLLHHFKENHFLRRLLCRKAFCNETTGKGKNNGKQRHDTNLLLDIASLGPGFPKLSEAGPLLTKRFWHTWLLLFTERTTKQTLRTSSRESSKRHGPYPPFAILQEDCQKDDGKILSRNYLSGLV